MASPNRKAKSISGTNGATLDLPTSSASGLGANVLESLHLLRDSAGHLVSFLRGVPVGLW